MQNRSSAFRLVALLLPVLAACGRRAEDPAREAGRRLAAAAAATRAAFRRLPPCPAAAPLPRAVTARWLPASGGARLPPEFERDTVDVPMYFEGGVHYRAGARVVKVIGGPYGWASFTGHYAGGGQVPGGCRARVGGLEYLVSRSADSEGHHASAVPITDTTEVRGEGSYQVTAPEPPLEFLLQILATRYAPKPNE